MKVAIRMDDITPDMDWEKFRIFKQILDEYHICPLIGVVPDNQDEILAKNPPRQDFWAYIKDLQKSGWCIAMHGYQHIYTTKKGGVFPLNSFSEFAGVPYEKQKVMLTTGYALLKKQGIETDIFMPPAHSFDKNTIRILKELGFRYMTDGFGDMPFEREGMVFLPICERKSRDLSGEGITTYVIHANTMEEKDFEFYRTLFAENETVNYSHYFTMPYKKRGFFGNVKEYMMALAKQYMVKLLTMRRK
ncbi:MAG: DUF2334 domain-containing protein [Lachnospiraceae bacterium]|nr:DUF2334 domain-containing protein [Lachnospiraceae bacterium]